MKRNLSVLILISVVSFLLFSLSSCKREGCTNSKASNYDSKAKTDDGSCIIYGCTNIRGDNYDPDANRDDGSCIIRGCTDVNASNYDPEATQDDGSCIYPNGQAIFWTDDDYGVGNISVYVSNNYVGQITGYQWLGTPDCGDSYFVTIERKPGTYPFYATASYGTYWQGTITINANQCSRMMLYVSKHGESLHSTKIENTNSSETNKRQLKQ